MRASAQLLIVRHAQTQANSVGRYLGEDDVLSSVGIQQAERLARALVGFEVSHILHSGSVRVAQTLTAAAAGIGDAEVREEFQLREGSVGTWTDMPSGMRARESMRAHIPLWEVRPPGGESWADIDRRLNDFVDRDIRSFKGQCLLLLGSGRTNSLIIRRLCGMSWDSYDPRQMLHTGVSALHAVTDETLLLDQCVDHLPVSLRTR